MVTFLVLWLFFSLFALPAVLFGGLPKKAGQRAHQVVLTLALLVQLVIVAALHYGVVFIEPTYNYIALGVVWLGVGLQLGVYKLMKPGRLFKLVRVVMVLGALTGILMLSFVAGTYRKIPPSMMPSLTQEEMEDGLYCRKRVNNGIMGLNTSDAFLYQRLESAPLLMQQIAMPPTAALFSSNCAMLYQLYHEGE